MSTETFTYLGMLYSPIRERLRTHKVPEFSYSLSGVFFFFCCFLFFVVFFVYNFLQLFKDIRVLQGNLQPVNKKNGGMTFQLKFALYLPHLKSFELMHFRRRLRRVDCRFYREPEILKQVIL